MSVRLVLALACLLATGAAVSGCADNGDMYGHHDHDRDGDRRHDDNGDRGGPHNGDVQPHAPG